MFLSLFNNAFPASTERK